MLIYLFVQIPVRDSEAYRPDRVPVTLCVSPGGAVPAALSAREDTMHARGTITLLLADKYAK